ncbi:transposase family protein [Bacillus thuringiensis]|nr:transposase family protein [Bacillus thuringiensis]MRB61475.1 transposase family protein [Bacillus thuringiensis]
MRKISWFFTPFLILKDISPMEDHLRLTIENTQSSHPCPRCHYRFSRPHSRYTSLIQDLPISDHPIRLLLLSPKWFCDSLTCPVKVFTERYDWIASNGRRTIRAENVLRKIAFSTSCLAGEKVAQARHLPVTHDVLLAIIHKTNIKVEVSPFCRNR